MTVISCAFTDPWSRSSRVGSDVAPQAVNRPLNAFDPAAYNRRLALATGRSGPPPRSVMNQNVQLDITLRPGTHALSGSRRAPTRPTP